ncbi:MinD/ParA family ATP-binding protein [Rhodococcus sp. WMMA185]|uniref:MinD/ParA family ATP-binding protein n=1 Tax=Rhodococcus sp. WMMA185 TaxID=679318 RepID=UPI0009FBEA7F|nr:MinD/ParA family protein [Rhodococcus sp. WMMA185]
MSENNAGGAWEPVRSASNPPVSDRDAATENDGSQSSRAAARQAPYVQPQGRNPFAQAPASPSARPQKQAQAPAAASASASQAPAPQSQAPAPGPQHQQAPGQQQAAFAPPPRTPQQSAGAGAFSRPQQVPGQQSQEQHPPRQQNSFTPPAQQHATGPQGFEQQGFEQQGFEPQGFEPQSFEQQGFGHEQQYAMSARDLSTSLLLRQAKPAPTTGWRKMLYKVSGGRINVGSSAKEQRRLDLTEQVNEPLHGCYKIALLSLKGGVGKTTMTATLGSTFASLRGDRVIAVDANPDRGTLSQKIPLETPATVRNLLRDEQSIEKYSDVRSYTSQSRHRLEVLASDSDPAVSEAFSGDDYARTVKMLEKFYSIVLTDCGTGLMHSAMQTILEEADSLVVVSSGSVDGVRSASATLDWLDAHGYRELVSKSVAVVNAVRPRSGKVDLPKVVEHFEQRCRRVSLIPFDPHLEEGAEIELERLHPKTRNALLELAAAVASDFPAADFALQDRR